MPISENASKLETLLTNLMRDDPDFKDYMVNLVAKKTMEIRTSGSMPYYKEVFAREMASTLDMINNDTEHRNFIYLYADFPNHRPSSLYLRINQSLRYLLDHLDPEGHYADIRSKILIDRASNKAGIQIAWIKDMLEENPLQAKPLSDNAAEYVNQITEFLQDEKRGILNLKNLALTQHEIDIIEESVADVESVFPFVTSREIRMIKKEWKK